MPCKGAPWQTSSEAPTESLMLLAKVLHEAYPSLSSVELVEVLREEDGRWLAGARVPGSTLLLLQGHGLAGRGAHGVLHADGSSELVRASSTLCTLAVLLARQHHGPRVLANAAAWSWGSKPSLT